MRENASELNMTADTPEQDNSILIDWRDLSSEALENILEDLVTRGEPDEMDLETRRRQLLAALKNGQTRLYFDQSEETIFLRTP